MFRLYAKLAKLQALPPNLTDQASLMPQSTNLSCIKRYLKKLQIEIPSDCNVRFLLCRWSYFITNYMGHRQPPLPWNPDHLLESSLDISQVNVKETTIWEMANTCINCWCKYTKYPGKLEGAFKGTTLPSTYETSPVWEKMQPLRSASVSLQGLKLSNDRLTPHFRKGPPWLGQQIWPRRIVDQRVCSSLISGSLAVTDDSAVVLEELRRGESLVTKFFGKALLVWSLVATSARMSGRSCIMYLWELLLASHTLGPTFRSVYDSANSTMMKTYLSMVSLKLLTSRTNTLGSETPPTSSDHILLILSFSVVTWYQMLTKGLSSSF